MYQSSILRTNLQGSSILEELKLEDSCGLVINIRSCVDFIFFPALQWYMLSVVYMHHHIKSSELCCYLNGRAVLSAEVTLPNTDDVSQQKYTNLRTSTCGPHSECTRPDDVIHKLHVRRLIIPIVTISPSQNVCTLNELLVPHMYHRCMTSASWVVLQCLRRMLCSRGKCQLCTSSRSLSVVRELLLFTGWGQPTR